jgi:exodeoxyribonuclease V alpha subunit
MLTNLQGQIERITYSNDEAGYTIAKVKVYGRRDLVTVVGNFMAPMPGEILWRNFKDVGKQGNFTSRNIGIFTYRNIGIFTYLQQ